MLSSRVTIHGAITSIYQPYSREFMESIDDLNADGSPQQNKNSLETILTQGAREGVLDGVTLSDDMIKSYICTAHLRIIRQLNCTIRALRECQRKLDGSIECASPQPEQEQGDDTKE